MAVIFNHEEKLDETKLKMVALDENTDFLKST